jgi:hypothetical protein
MCSSAPDTSGINAAAQANAAVARDALDWYKTQYTAQAPLRDAAAQRAQAVSDAQLKAMGTATDIANKDEQYRESVFQPLERGIVADAQNYDTLDQRDKAAGQAVADVRMAGTASRNATERNMERMGVNPSDGAYGSMERAGDANIALASAGAANRARDQVRTVGHAMQMDAASLGRGLPGNQATQAGIALNSGNAAVASGNVPVSLAQQGTQMVGQGFQTAISGNNSAGNLYGSAANIEMQGNKDDLSGLANLGMAGKYIFSDKNMKTGIKPLKGEVALAAVKKLPVKGWKYKQGSPADDGGASHIGPMAQDVNAQVGEHAAPGGKMVDLGTLTGLALAAVQQLDDKHGQLERRQRATDDRVFALANGQTKSRSKA